MPYLSASAVVIQYEEALYQVHAPLPLPLQDEMKQEADDNACQSSQFASLCGYS